MGNSIQLLPDHVANQIAAGEVVQRPASVVKELMENAIDAGAGTISLIVKDGGKALIQVVDDGKGMTPADARLSFKRHATSKIRQAEDLFQLQSKGFRGEALASIAAIAHVEMSTRVAKAKTGIQLRLEGSKSIGEAECVCPVGTSVSVKNLFFNIPARRNFLKSQNVELRHITDEFHRLALAHPGLNFSMYHNDREIFNLESESYRKRIIHLFGHKTHEKLVPIEEETQVANIKGFVMKPEYAKKSRGEQFFFVNDRFIKSGYLHHAIMGAYEGLLRPDTYPGYFIYFEVPTEAIDINIHPTKTEVKFEDEQSIYAILKATVKHSLGQFSIAPVLDFDKDPNLDTPYGYQKKPPVLPGVKVDRDFNPFGGPSKPQRKTGEWQALYSGLEATSSTVAEHGLIIESDAETPEIFEAESNEESFSGITFQLGRKYIVTRMKSGMLLVDQNRAHQRVLYEQFLKNITVGEQVSQQLLFPLKLSFNPADLALLQGLEENLTGMGFRFGQPSEAHLEITGLPVMIPENEVVTVLDGLLSDWKHQGEHTNFSQSDRLAKALCKSLAIPSGTVLEAEAQQALINDLFGCKETQYSPFQKIIHRLLTVEELENKFK